MPYTSISRTVFPELSDPQDVDVLSDRVEFGIVACCVL